MERVLKLTFACTGNSLIIIIISHVGIPNHSDDDAINLFLIYLFFLEYYKNADVLKDARVDSLGLFSNRVSYSYHSILQCCTWR